MGKIINNKQLTTIEWCDECGQENEISSNGGYCKNCGEWLRPCSTCDMDNVDCNNCPYLSMETRQRLNKMLGTFIGRRFDSTDEIINSICIQDGFFRGHLVEDNTNKDHISDDILIGSVETVDNLQFDIQLFYIKDNYNNYYITETEVLEEI